MCGIVGIWQRNKNKVSSGLLIRMRDSICFRGPDDAGIWLNGEVGLAHRRLSVIDLSSLGHQPMFDEETGSVIVYNGEVYNYRIIRAELEKYGINFKSQTDTEVVLKAYRYWGKSCVDHFVGMFAFVIWDARQRGIFVARDRIGIKPLYYYSNNKLFLFASRLSPLMIHPLCPQDIDEEALGLYLELGFVPAPWSILKGVKKLKPGHTLWVDERGLRETCYWNIDAISIDTSLMKVSEQDLIERLDDLLKAAVKLRLVSDVPLGAFLSGGVDSSLITALMCQFSEAPPRTFTIGFEEEQHDESGYARQIAAYLGTNHYEQKMKSNDLLDLLNDNIKHYDEPFADFSSLPTMLVSKFAREKVTVCLSGDGGDELFAGYHCYSIPFFLKPLYRIPYALRFPLGKFLASITSRRYSIIGECFAKKDILNSFMAIRRITSEHHRHTLFKEEVLSIRDLFKERSSRFASLDEISKFCRLDLAYYLPDDILQKVDVASMSVSLEARVPLLDHRVVEFSQSLPIKYKLRGGTTKRLLKKVLFKYLPEDFFKRPKKGFVIPLDKWFRGELKDMLQDELSLSAIRRLGFLNPEGVQRLINLHLSNKCNTHHIVWALLSLVKWHERFKIKKFELNQQPT